MMTPAQAGFGAGLTVKLAFMGRCPRLCYPHPFRALLLFPAEVQQHPGAEFRAAQDPGSDPPSESQTRDDAARAALDGSNAAQEFVGGNLRIVMVERIPPGDPIGGALVECPLHHAVGEKSPLPGKQYDIAWERLGGTAPAHAKDVARPDGGQHAGAGSSQAQSPRGAEHLRRKLTSQRFPGCATASCDRFAHECLLL